MIAHEMHFKIFKMKARLLDVNGHNGYLIRVTTIQVGIRI